MACPETSPGRTPRSERRTTFGTAARLRRLPPSPTTHPSSHPVRRRPTHRGAGVVHGVQVERATVRTTWTPWAASARLCLGRWRTGWEHPAHATTDPQSGTAPPPSRCRPIPRRPRGGRLRRSNFRDDWIRARVEAGVTADVHFHDLRHTGNTLAASGASLRELMTRMGHSTPRAALIYQHMVSGCDREIADRLGSMIRKERGDVDS